jgi:tetratricopeptide (TPR) repeat protein
MLGWSVLTGVVAGRGALRVGGAVLVGLVAALTAVQAATWRDVCTMWTRAVRIAPGNAFAQYRLADAERHAGDEDSGLRRLREAVRLRPYFPEAQSALGAVLAARGELDEALRPSAQVLANVGIVLARQGRPAEAAARYREALRLRPDIAAIQVNLAYALSATGDASGARQGLEAALRLEPGNAAARAGLAALGAPPP